MTHNTREVEEIEDLETKVRVLVQGVYDEDISYTDATTEIIKLLHHQLQKAREEERDRILSNILKWSKTATVTETTGREGAKRATTKLRNSLAGCYHFLYQALRINHSELDQNNK